MGVIADALRANLRELALSDARLYRSLADGSPAQQLPVSKEDRIAEAIRLLEANGYKVTR